MKHPRWLYRNAGGVYDHSHTLPKWQCTYATMEFHGGTFEIMVRFCMHQAAVASLLSRAGLKQLWISTGVPS